MNHRKMSFSKCGCYTWEGRTYTELNFTPLPLIKAKKTSGNQNWSSIWLNKSVWNMFSHWEITDSRYKYVTQPSSHEPGHPVCCGSLTDLMEMDHSSTHTHTSCEWCVLAFWKPCKNYSYQFLQLTLQTDKSSATRWKLNVFKLAPGCWWVIGPESEW